MVLSFSHLTVSGSGSSTKQLKLFFSPTKREGIRSGILIVRLSRTGRKHITCNVNYSGPRRALGNFNNDDGEENVKKAKGLSSKTTIFHVANAFIFVHFFSVPARLQKFNFRETGLDMTFSVN